MASKAETVFGQVLICLRMSKLDYMIKETPYSAYLTVRKKFAKGVKEEVIEVNSVEKDCNEDKKNHLEKENIFLKEKVMDLEKLCSILKTENIDFDIKVKTLEKDKESLEEELEEAYSDSKELRSIVERQKKSEQKSLESFKELDESVLMLENQVKAREFEVYKLKEELQSFEASTSLKNIQSCEHCSSESELESNSEEPIGSLHEKPKKGYSEATSSKTLPKCDDCDFRSDVKKMKVHRLEMHDFPCDFCDYEAKHSAEMKSHKIEMHGVICEFCDLTFISDQKFETHMCRKHIKNPDYMDMYVKNWVVRNSCIPVFSKLLEKEIILLHSELCWENKNFCQEIPESLDTLEKSVVDDNGRIHGSAKSSGSVEEDGSICWLAVRGLMLGKMEDYQMI